MPAGATAAANGVPIGKLTHRGRTHWVFVQRQPMATELIQIAVGGYDDDRRPAGTPACFCATSRRRA